MSLGDPGDPRPPVWVGHLVLGVSDVPESKAFYLALGMRDVEPESAVGILELRAGTHLILLPSEHAPEAGSAAPFDLMVEDIDRARRHCVDQDLAPSALREEQFHRSFTVRDPSGYDVTLNSSHASGEPV